MAKLRALDVKKEIEIKEWRLQEQRAREQEMYKDTQELMAAQRVVKEAISLDENSDCTTVAFFFGFGFGCGLGLGDHRRMFSVSICFRLK